MSRPKHHLIHQIRFKTLDEKEEYQNMLANMKHETGKPYTELVRIAVENMYRSWHE